MKFVPITVQLLLKGGLIRPPDLHLDRQFGVAIYIKANTVFRRVAQFEALHIDVKSSAAAGVDDLRLAQLVFAVLPWDAGRRLVGVAARAFSRAALQLAE